MSEELIQRNLTESGKKFGNYELYNIGSTNINNLVKYKIINNEICGQYKNKEPDVIVVDRRNKLNIQVIFVVEYKDVNEINTKKKLIESLKQCNNYCEIVKAKFGVITNGKDYYWINPQKELESCEYTYIDDYDINRGFDYIKDENGTNLKNSLDIHSEKDIQFIEKLVSVISQNNSSLIRAETKSPSLLAKKVWQAVWLATGDDPKKCLMTFTELFIFKFLSDLNILNKDENAVPIDFKTVFNVGKLKCLKYYISNVRPHIKSMFPVSDTDNTTIINGLSLKKEQNQDELFYGILKAFDEYGELRNIDPSFKSRLYEEFLKGTTGKKQLAQFFTPRNVIKSIIDMANIKKLTKDSKISDPSGGVGGFIIESLLTRTGNKNEFWFEDNELKSKLSYTSYDYDELTVILGKANMLLSLTDILENNPSLTVDFSKLLHKTFNLANNKIIGSLGVIEPETYDLIITNPPYVSKGLSHYKKYINDNGEYKKFYDIPCIGKEGLFVQKIVKELKSNGLSKAFIVLPDGFFYRPADNELKTFILNNCFIDCIISLPEKTFYATNKKTYILGITKKENITDEQEYDVICGLIEHIGEELKADRLPIPQNDLTTFSSNYKQYMADTEKYQVNDKKIKLISISKFKENLNWIVEKYWDENELISMGLKEPVRNISENDMIDNIEAFQSDMIDIKSGLSNLLKNSNNISYKDVTLFEEKYFKLNTSLLGFTRKEYSVLDTKNANDYPIYTATLEPVAFIQKQKNIEPFIVKNSISHISFASDGDGTAGKNIVLHNCDYYLNTSRISFEIIDNNIIPKYVFYFIQDIKSKYGYDYNHKANVNNIKEIKIFIPIDCNGNFDIQAQQQFINEYEKLIEFKKKKIEVFFEKMDLFKSDIENQLNKIFKDSFNI